MCQKLHSWSSKMYFSFFTRSKNIFSSYIIYPITFFHSTQKIFFLHAKNTIHLLTYLIVSVKLTIFALDSWPNIHPITFFIRLKISSSDNFFHSTQIFLHAKFSTIHPLICLIVSAKSTNSACDRSCIVDQIFIR